VPEIRLLGAFQLLTSQGESLSLPTRKAKALLAYLATLFHAGNWKHKRITMSKSATKVHIVFQHLTTICPALPEPA
jgi:hypothetical protein